MGDGKEGGGERGEEERMCHIRVIQQCSGVSAFDFLCRSPIVHFSSSATFY